jgi:hypothetical protein
LIAAALTNNNKGYKKGRRKDELSSGSGGIEPKRRHKSVFDKQQRVLLPEIGVDYGHIDVI